LTAERAGEVAGNAEASGGEVVSRDELGEFFEHLSRRPLKALVQVIGVFRLWDTPYILAILMGVLSAEWVVRRRNCLV
jgi:hypothetical protein